MLHIEKIFDEDGIQSEIDAYAPLVPDGTNWKATMLIEYPDPHERKRELSSSSAWRTACSSRSRAMGASTPSPTKTWTARTRRPRLCTSCVSEFPSAARGAVRVGASVKLGCDHTNYPAHVVIPAESLASLAGDLK